MRLIYLRCCGCNHLIRQKDINEVGCHRCGMNQYREAHRCSLYEWVLTRPLVSWLVGDYRIHTG